MGITQPESVVDVQRALSRIFRRAADGVSHQLRSRR
jgi:hypothetical protein